ncbi:hypothetical protein [Rhodomicrobium lacus]|uniref:hypothetical protein n=1 Tax=Rhodomicrobium lacus TaxID=2498452 RepID=UPI000F8D059D|nr:hypothetical protein [Rhodomicrobium lacus]
MAQVVQTKLPTITIRHQKPDDRNHQNDRSALPKDLQSGNNDIGTEREQGDRLEREVRQRCCEGQNVDSRKWSTRHPCLFATPNEPQIVQNIKHNGLPQQVVRETVSPKNGIKVNDW